ncbi:alpha/beta hydrolase [Nocardia sp. NPDC006630]|uniref:alpha/beta fold hydrolase n=1 Tax=Nocardia sp. NPDC006630 TaxID=3157181 RepID=UPI0033A77A89
MERLPIVLVHGIRLSGMSWSVVRDNMDAGWPVLAIDLPGHGGRRGERFTLSAGIDAIMEAIDQLGGRALVVGHSLGGYVSIAAAGRHPDQIAGLVLAGCTTAPSSRALTTPFLLMHRVLSTLPDQGDAISRQILRTFLPRPVVTAIERGGIATEAIPDAIASIRGSDPVGGLGRYSGPVWFLNGSHDHFRRHEQRFLAASPNGRLMIIPRAGHYLPLARPAEFSRLLLDFARAGTALTNAAENQLNGM